jgi:dynein heavy chain, axonemal
MWLILQSIVEWWVTRAAIPSDIASLGNALVAATLALYDSVRAHLLPTPAKSHYTYNTRDLSKVFQGMASFAGTLDTRPKLVR